MDWVEIKLGHKLVCLVITLHNNELPLIHLITALDGKILSNREWTSNIGKMLGTTTELVVYTSFTKLSIGEPY